MYLNKGVRIVHIANLKVRTYQSLHACMSNIICEHATAKCIEREDSLMYDIKYVTCVGLDVFIN